MINNKEITRNEEMDRIYYVDKYDNIYYAGKTIEKYDEAEDPVIGYLECSCKFSRVTLGEINEEMNDIIDNYYEWGDVNYNGDIRRTYADEYGIDECLKNDGDYYNLKYLSDKIENGETIELNRFNDDYLKLFIKSEEKASNAYFTNAEITELQAKLANY